MKKLVISLALVFAMLLTLAACGKAKEEEKIPEADEAVFTINGLEFRLEQEDSFNGLGYTITEDFTKVEHSMAVPYVQYNYYQEDDTNLLFFRIFYYRGKGDDAAVKDLGLEGDIKFTERKIGELDYRFYEQPRDDGGTIHFYFLSKDDDTYVINFVSRYDISEFERKVMDRIHLQ